MKTCIFFYYHQIPWKDQSRPYSLCKWAHRELFSFLCVLDLFIFKDVSISVSCNFVKRGKWIADILQDWPGWQQDSENVGLNPHNSHKIDQT